MTIKYNGKYPNRIESVWRVSEKINPKKPWMFRTNVGALYEFVPSKYMISPSDILGVEYDKVPNAKWVDNSTKRVPGPKHQLK